MRSVTLTFRPVRFAFLVLIGCALLAWYGWGAVALWALSQLDVTFNG